jgi:hypothetical protein
MMGVVTCCAMHVLISMPAMVTVDNCAVFSINRSITASGCRSRGDCFQKEVTPLEPSLFADIRHLIFLYLQAFKFVYEFDKFSIIFGI